MNVRFGVIGCGAIHRTHCDALGRIDGATLAAVYDVDPNRGSAAAFQYDVPAAPTLDKLWPQVDAVCVCVPSGLHHEIGIAAAQAGKHVLVEKPIDVRYQTALKLVEACAQAKVKLGTISQHRFAPDIQRVREAAQGGELGRLLAGDMYNKWYRTQSYYDSGDWRGTWDLDGGGCLMNQGVHYIDMIQWIMGGVKAVRAVTRTASHEIEVEDIANALIEYENGAIGIVQGSTSVFPGLAERLEIHGTSGTVIVEADRIKLWEVDPDGASAGLYGRGIQSQPTPNVHTHGQTPSAGGAADPTAIWVEQHRLQIEDFTRAIQNNRDPAVTGQAALAPLKIILAIYESARLNGERVELQNFTPN